MNDDILDTLSEEELNAFNEALGEFFEEDYSRKRQKRKNNNRKEDK